jgi:hypothetical protein
VYARGRTCGEGGEHVEVEKEASLEREPRDRYSGSRVRQGRGAPARCATVYLRVTGTTTYTDETLLTVTCTAPN